MKKMFSKPLNPVSAGEEEEDDPSRVDRNRVGLVAEQFCGDAFYDINRKYYEVRTSRKQEILLLIRRMRTSWNRARKNGMAARLHS